MKIGLARQVALMVAVPLLLSAGLAVAEEMKQPSGTITIDEEQAMFLIGGDIGGGTLEYNGKSYPFKLDGLKVGGVGIEKTKFTGEVYDLNDIADFPGQYAVAEIGFTVADKRVGDLWVKNTKGVILRLKGQSEGLSLNVGADALNITMK
jgi:hypothetical protein